MNAGANEVSAEQLCLVCGGPSVSVTTAYPGYQRGRTYAIFACNDCRYSFAEPMRSEDSVYEAIYRRPALIPGYDRYDAYVRMVLASPRPLDALAQSEEPYWALREVVSGLRPDARILDVGSGLGYATYALSRSGYQATGLDISKNAIERARRRFGPLYAVADMFEWSKERAGHYDLVTMLELIEHVEDPGRWIEAAFRMVKPGGALLITTPNRDYYVDETVWETDAPPVHLWWFSARALARLTEPLAAQFKLVDFSRCNSPYATPYSDVPIHTRRSPMLDERGRPASRARRVIAALGLLPVAKAVYARLHQSSEVRAHPNPGTRETLAAILRKP